MCFNLLIICFYFDCKYCGIDSKSVTEYLIVKTLNTNVLGFNFTFP
jgi:hypothetical protein